MENTTSAPTGAPGAESPAAATPDSGTSATPAPTSPGGAGQAEAESQGVPGTDPSGSTGSEPTPSNGQAPEPATPSPEGEAEAAARGAEAEAQTTAPNGAPSLPEGVTEDLIFDWLKHTLVPEEYRADDAFFRMEGGTVFKDLKALIRSVPVNESFIAAKKQEVAEKEAKIAEYEKQVEELRSGLDSHTLFTSILAQKIGVDSPDTLEALTILSLPDEFRKEPVPEDFEDADDPAKAYHEARDKWVEARVLAKMEAEKQIASLKEEHEKAQQAEAERIERATKLFTEHVTPKALGAETSAEEYAAGEMLKAKAEALTEVFGLDEEIGKYAVMGMKMAFLEKVGRDIPLPENAERDAHREAHKAEQASQEGDDPSPKAPQEGAQKEVVEERLDTRPVGTATAASPGSAFSSPEEIMREAYRRRAGR